MSADCDAIYARVSSGRQEKERTIDGQILAIHEKFDPDGRPLYKLYADDPFTGTAINRPALDACLRDAEAGHFDRLLVYNPSRLARGKAWVRPWLEEQFAKRGVRVEYVTYKVEDSPMGRAMDNFQSGFDEWHREVILENTANGLASKEARGSFHWARPPYGWRYIPQAAGEKDGQIEQVPEEAPIVREMFDLVLAGKSCYAVADILDTRGLRTRSGAKFTGKAVASVMHNLVHSGRLVKGRYKGAIPDRPRNAYNTERKTSVRLQGQSAWRIHELPLRIVTPEEQDAAIARLAVNQKRSKRNAKHPFLLSGLVRCGHEREGQPGQPCGRVMTGIAKTNGQRHYQCTRNRSTDAVVSVSCKGWVKADALEEKVWGAVMEILAHPEALLDRLEKDKGAAVQRREALIADINAYHAEQERTQRKLDSLLDMRLANQVDPPTYARKEAGLVALRDQAAQAVEHLTGEMEDLGQYEERLKNMREYGLDRALNLASLCAADEGAAFNTKQSYVREVLTAVWLHPDGSIRLEGMLPVEKPGGWLATFPAPDPQIVTQSPWSLVHNMLRFSLMIAA